MPHHSNRDASTAAGSNESAAAATTSVRPDHPQAVPSLASADGSYLAAGPDGERPIESKTGNQSPTGTRHWVVAAMCLAAITAYMQRTSMGVAEKSIREDLGINEVTMGWLMSAFFLTYALFQIPAAKFDQTRGTRRALSIFSIGWSVLGGAMAFAWGPFSVAFSRLGLGATQAGIFPSAISAFSRWLPIVSRSTASGFLASCMSIGGAIGNTSMGAMLGPLGWRTACLLCSIPGILWAVVFYYWYRDDPEEHASVNPAELQLIQQGRGITPSSATSGATTHQPTPWGMLLSDLSLWGLFAQQFFRAAGYIFAGSWLATYLRETRGVQDLGAGLLSSMPLLAFVIGCPIGGAISDYLLRRTGSRFISQQLVASVCMLACAATVWIAYGIHDPTIFMLIVTLGSLFAAFGGPVAYTAAIDKGGDHRAAVFATMNMCGNIGAAAFIIIVPYLTKQKEDWDRVLLMFGGVYVLAGVSWLFVAPDRKVGAIATK